MAEEAKPNIIDPQNTLSSLIIPPSVIADDMSTTATEVFQPLTPSSPPLEEVLVNLPEATPPSRKTSNSGKSPKSELSTRSSSHRKNTLSLARSSSQEVDAATVQPISSSSKTNIGETNHEGPDPSLVPPEEGYDDSPIDIPDVPKINIDQVAPFWERYNKAADFEDREFVKAEGVNLDTLLIFAGLFSGVNTAFILESLKTIQPDRAEQANHLIRAVVHVLQNSTAQIDIIDDLPFQAPPRAVRATIVFFASLSCSLAAAFGAVLGKQWLNHYEREGVLKSPPARARERQKKSEARNKWRLEGVVETLPTVLQISLFLFLIGLVDYLEPINKTVSLAVLGFSLVPALFYVVTIAIATLYPIAPFQTRLSIALHQLSLRLYQWTLLLFNKSCHLLRSLNGRLKTGAWLSKIPLLVVCVGWLWESLFLVIEWVSRQTSSLYTFIRQAWPSPPNHSPPQLTLPTNEDTVDLLNMRCMIFTCKRVSTLHEIGSVLPALDSLMQSLPNGLDQHHPIPSLFAQTAISFIIKPLDYSTQQDNYRTGWEAAGIDVRYLVRAVHCLFIKWGYAGTFNSSFRTEMGRGLWASFHREPRSDDLVTILTQLVSSTNLTSITLSDPSHETLDLLIRCLRSPPTWRSREINSYLSLLAHLPQHGRLHYRNHSLPLSYTWETKLIKIVPALLLTMWDNNEPDLDHWRGWIRVHLLLSHAQDRLLEHRFSEYLLLWSRANIYGQPGDGTLSAEWTYLQSFYELIQLDTTGRTWSERLEEDGHPQFLLLLVAAASESPYSLLEPIQSLNALFLFLTLWDSRRSQSHNLAVDNTPSIYLTSDSLIAAVKCLAVHIPPYLVPILGDISSNLELTVSFLEEGSRLQLLTDNMKTVVQAYKTTTDDILERLYGDDDQVGRCRDQQQSLFDRMDRLTFTKSN